MNYFTIGEYPNNTWQKPYRILNQHEEPISCILIESDSLDDYFKRHENIIMIFLCFSS